MIDMTQNRVSYGLLTEEEKAILHEHKRAGGIFECTYNKKTSWIIVNKPYWNPCLVYRTVPLSQDENA